MPESLVATVTVAGDDVSGVVLMPLQPGDDHQTSIVRPAHAITGAVNAPTDGRVQDTSHDDAVAYAGRPVIDEDFTFEAKAAPGDESCADGDGVRLAMEREIRDA